VSTNFDSSDVIGTLEAADTSAQAGGSGFEIFAFPLSSPRGSYQFATERGMRNPGTTKQMEKRDPTHTDSWAFATSVTALMSCRIVSYEFTCT
jgi:hypothetical protein